VGQDTWEEYRNIVKVCMEAKRKAKVSLELNLAKGAKDNKKGFFKYISSKRKDREKGSLLLNGGGALLTENTEKEGLLNIVFDSIFIAKAGPQASQSLEVREKAWRNENLPLVKKDPVRHHLSKLDTHKSMDPDGMHP